VVVWERLYDRYQAVIYGRSKAGRRRLGGEMKQSSGERSGDCDGYSRHVVNEMQTPTPRHCPNFW